MRLRLLSSFSALYLMLASFEAHSQSCDQVRLSGHPNLPPVVWGNYLSILGSAPELVSEMLSEHGISVTTDFKGGYNRVLRDFKMGKFDINPAMARTPEAEEYTLFVEPPIYTQSYIVITNRRSGLNISSWEQLRKLKGVASKDTYLGARFEAFANKELDLIRIQNAKQGLKMLNVGRVDYAIYPQIQDDLFVSLLDMEGVFEKMPVDVATFELYVGISKASPCTFPMEAMSDWIQHSFKSGHSSHVLNDNLYKWMGYGLDRKP
ncbi:transporter substrate-binding domain-containing protein [Aestuariirhabdus sp. Z084]|uniref:transporter substrate-binding domain-containing protein n=1 Tax=Aestuariirhabdus haliotis TaxID=2918751 RepID=UPI00201B431F|nr:transporter substrate-binding domain-containing protein [Aestuariirhabdus haliotis]MCL6416654.1 transporter substrate-binding domain-containing protein [Aestuariirhabdus haliotis]MCL6421088.1 transporter substrate-binding domain-containing protein [Aestuariirhabdus haliotis]